MTIKYYDKVEQGTDEWLQLRCGVLTASVLKNLVSAKTGKMFSGEKPSMFLNEILAQRVTGHVVSLKPNADMLRGQIDEPIARDLYSEKYAPVVETGFITNDKWGFTLGYSPDGLVNEDGLIEIKSRLDRHQFKTIYEDKVPDEYMIQCQSGLMISERQWIDFISYSGGNPMYVKRVLPDFDLQDAIIEAVTNFEKSASIALDAYKENSKNLIMTERIEEL